MRFMVSRTGHFSLRLVQKRPGDPRPFLLAVAVAVRLENSAAKVPDKSNTKLPGSISVDSFNVHAALVYILLSKATLV